MSQTSETREQTAERVARDCARIGAELQAAIATQTRRRRRLAEDGEDLDVEARRIARRAGIRNAPIWQRTIQGRGPSTDLILLVDQSSSMTDYDADPARSCYRERWAAALGATEGLALALAGIRGVRLTAVAAYDCTCPVLTTLIEAGEHVWPGWARDVLKTKCRPRQGTNWAEPIRWGVAELAARPVHQYRRRVVLAISDGELYDRAEHAAIRQIHAEAASIGVEVYGGTIGQAASWGPALPATHLIAAGEPGADWLRAIAGLMQLHVG